MVYSDRQNKLVRGFLGLSARSGCNLLSARAVWRSIILDQSWALEAIYALFNRTTSYPKLLRRRGRFYRDDLETLVWKNYSVEEQREFLRMMLACGICFVHRRGP